MAVDGLSGLASGVDTASTVENLMALERRGKTRLGLRQTANTSQQAALKDLKAKLDALRTAAADLRSVTTWAESQTVESSDPARVAVARTGGAPIGGYSLRVLKLAAAAQKTYAWTPSASATQLDIDGKLVDMAADAKITDVAAVINGRGLALAQKIVGAAVDADPALVVEPVRGALRGLVERERITVLVHPDDLELVRGAMGGVVSSLGGVEHAEVQAERRVARGGAVVRTPEGDVDAGIDTKLTRAREVVAAALGAGT